MSTHIQVATFEMADGRILSCEAEVTTWPGVYHAAPEDCYPTESEVTGPLICRIDGEEIDRADLPKGLAAVADELVDSLG